MDNFFEAAAQEHFLFGTLIVRAVHRNGRPIQGLRLRIGASAQEACGKG